MRLPARALLLAAGLGLAAPAALAGQGTPDDPWVVAMVVWRGETPVEQGFRAYLAEQGVAADIRVLDVAQSREAIPAAVAAIRALRPDLVYTWGTSVTLGVAGPYDAVDAARHITDVPIVFTLVADPVGARIVPEFASSGRNLTGAAFLAPVETQLRTIASYGPLDRLAVIYNPLERNSLLNVEELESFAPAMGFRVIRKPAPLGDDQQPDGGAVPRLVAEARAEGADWLYIGPDSFTAVHGEALTAAALTHRLPTFAATERPLRGATAMMGLVSNYFTLGRFVAFKALQILAEGKAPAALPVETLARFSLVLNIDVANALRFYPPLRMLAYADLITDRPPTGASTEETHESEAPARERAPAGPSG